MRKLETRQLRVLPDLLNSCPDIASKVTRVRTLANMLAAAPLPSSMFNEVDKLVRIYLTIPVTTATEERSFSAVRCIKTYLHGIYHVPVAPQQHNADQCPQGFNEWIGFVHHRQAVRGCQWTPQAFLFWTVCAVHNETHQIERLGLILGTARLELFGNLTACILYYTILYYTILYYTILYYTILCYAMLCYAMLCYTILYYTILYYTILYYTILCRWLLYNYMTVDYMTVADTRLAPINEQLITFIYSLLLLFITYCRLCHVYYCAIVSLSIHVFGQASTCRITGIRHPWLDYTCRCIDWLLTYFEMSRHALHYFSA